jgi:hypothetical protein
VNKKRSAANLLVCLALVIAAAAACSNSSGPPVPNNAASNSTSNSQTTSSTPAAKRDIAGNYDAAGTNVNGGGAYKASLVVTPRDDVYQFSWDSAGNKYDGVGVVTDNTVAVSYTEGPNGKGCGVVLYKIGADGSLDGKSGYWGVNSAETEKGTRKSGSDLDGTYDIAGTNVEGKDYKGTLEIKKDGEGYEFRWNAGSAFSGFGIKEGDKAIAGFGGKQCAFVAYDIKPDGTLDGKWGGQGNNSFGTETAKKK